MTTADSNWPFLDPRNVSVFTSKKIIQGDDWVYYVTHDVEDGAWQFHPYSGMTPDNEAAVVSLETMVNVDRSLTTLADLPLGWHAWRESPEANWQRAPRTK